jgi:hypothetical protein
MQSMKSERRFLKVENEIKPQQRTAKRKVEISEIVKLGRNIYQDF